MKLIATKSGYRSILSILAIMGSLTSPAVLTTPAQAKPDKTSASIGDIVIAGVVTRDTPGNDFYVRSDNGDRFLVVTKNQPSGIDTGVRVKVSGYYDGNQISAEYVGILPNQNRDDDSGSNGDRGIRTVTGVVTRDPGGNDFYIRSDSGQVYLVVSKSQPSNVTTGVRVKIKGWYDGDHLNANDIDVLGADDSYNRNNYTFGQQGKNITVSGVVTRDTPGDDFYVRTDNGDRYLVVTLKQPKKIDTGARVRVKGWYDGNRLSANTDDITVLGYANWNNNTQEGYLDVKGTVTKDLKGNDFVIRSEDDRIYMVVTKSQPKGIKSGARVRVKGWYDGDHLNANDVNVLDKGKDDKGFSPMGSLDAYKNKYVTIVGTVDRLTKNSSFYLRDGAGMTYLIVTAKQPDDLEVGARVQVFGYYNGSVMTSNKGSIKILDND